MLLNVVYSLQLFWSTSRDYAFMCTECAQLWAPKEQASLITWSFFVADLLFFQFEYVQIDLFIYSNNAPTSLTQLRHQYGEFLLHCANRQVELVSH